MSDQHSDQDMDLEDISTIEPKVLDRTDSMRPVNGEELDAWKRGREVNQEQTGENQDNVFVSPKNLSGSIDDEDYDYDSRRTMMAAVESDHWRRDKDSQEEPKDNQDNLGEERIIRLPSESEAEIMTTHIQLNDVSFVQQLSNSYHSLSQTALLKSNADCINFSQQDRELAYLKHCEIFENWKYTDEERAFLRHRVETFSREQCIIHCILGHMLMTPDEMLGARQTGLKPDDARQALLSLAIGSHWDVYNLAIIMAFSEKLNVLLRLSGDGLYRNLLEEPRGNIEGHIKVHVLEDTTTPYLLYSNL